MFGFGYNVFGQICGSKNTNCDDFEEGGLIVDGSEVIDVPVQIDINSPEEIVKIESSWASTFFLNKNGSFSIFGWIPGTKRLGKVNDFIPGEIVQDISSTSNKIVVLTKEGRLLLWSDFMHEGLSPIATKLEKSVSMIRCGDLQMIALTDDGHIGQVVTNISGLGDDKDIPSSMFFVEIPFSHCVQSVGCGKEHVLLLTNKGTVFSFGGGSRGQIGNGSLDAQDKPKIVEALAGIISTAISCGGWHSSVISSSGDLYMWGWNKDGQVGVSHTENNTDKSEVSVQIQAIPLPVVFTDDNVVDVSCGARHTAAITSNGELWTWGLGYYGQLGHGSRKSCYKPTKVTLSLPKLTTRAKSVNCNHWSTFVVSKK